MRSEEAPAFINMAADSLAATGDAARPAAHAAAPSGNKHAPKPGAASLKP
jgi:hypothetical protein